MTRTLHVTSIPKMSVSLSAECEGYMGEYESSSALQPFHAVLGYKLHFQGTWVTQWVKQPTFSNHLTSHCFQTFLNPSSWSLASLLTTVSNWPLGSGSWYCSFGSSPWLQKLLCPMPLSQQSPPPLGYQHLPKQTRTPVQYQLCEPQLTKGERAVSPCLS